MNRCSCIINNNYLRKIDGKNQCCFNGAYLRILIPLNKNTMVTKII